MNDIKWEDGTVCYAFGHQWREGDKLPDSYGGGIVGADLVQFIIAQDFQLNEIRQGDCMEASELDTEQKYNDAVEVFGLFGYYRGGNYTQFKESSDQWADFLICGNDMNIWASREQGKRKLSYPQLMAIGKLKRAMIERDNFNKVIAGFDPQTTVRFMRPSGCEIDSESRRNGTKALRAYDILKSMNIYYDEDKKVWYKKEYL